jgi:outer membrane protein assembly factor BamA|tara:strand:- start:39 stop:1856 length:1818 start_codon:yes stop_codon:yes gene_type:complete
MYIRIILLLFISLSWGKTANNVDKTNSGHNLIRSLILKGNDNISMNEILYIVRQRPPNFFFRRPQFEPRLLKLDALTLKSFYHSRGFLDVNVVESYIIEDGFVDIKYSIIEGKQYFLSNVEVVGNSSVPVGKIKDLLRLKEGEPYNPVAISDNRFMVENEYQKVGKLFLSLSIQDEIGDSVIVNINIDEGKDVYIKKTFLEKIGNIDSSLIWRELTYQDGDLYSKTTIDNTSRRLREMGVFSMANMIPVKISNSDSLVNMVIEFRRYKQREWNSSGGYDPIQFAEGAEPLPAISGTLEWRNRSFFNTPQQFSTKLLAGVPVDREFIIPRIRYDLTLAGNWFLGLRFPTRIMGYYETFLENNGQDDGIVPVRAIERFGLNLSQYVRFSNRSFFETKSVWESFSDESETNEKIEQRSISFKINIDRKNDPLFPRRGYVMTGLIKSAGYLFGGERKFLKGDLTFQSYLPVLNKSVIALRIKSGTIWGWNENNKDYSYEKFYLGGSTSMRGWDVLRFEESEGQPVGSSIRILTNLEYRSPLYKLLGITFFIDGGMLTDEMPSDYFELFKWDTGFGFTIQTPLGPARLDYAIQTSNHKNQKIQLGVQNLF